MVRFATKNDFDFVKNSWTECFDDSPQFVDWIFDCNYSAKNTVIAEYGEKNASVMQLIPYGLMLNGGEYSSRYISGVATLPEYRGKGLVRKLFGFALPKMYEMGTDISLLVPAVEGMYEKFGYRKVYDRHFIRTDSLCGMSITDFDAVPLEKLDEMYRTQMAKKVIYINRSKSDWRKILTDLIKLSGGSVLLFDNGYAFAYPKDGVYEVCEICGDAPIKGEQISQAPVMARVINARKFCLKNGVSDAFIPENNIPPQSGAECVDISELTGRVFGGFSEMYINMLL